jgi:BirA family biotin operon repressor/biotin-[acetyl-CoA-carboxylase] ligase
MDELLTLLAADEPATEAALCRRLGLTADALQGRVEALEEQGYRIAKNGGYRLSPEPGSLLPGYILVELTAERMGRGEILYAPEMGSTNTELKRTAAERVLPEGSIAVCDRQTHGKGRLDRRWMDAGTQSMLPCSLLTYPKLPPEKTQLITLAVAVAAAGAVGDFGLSAGIKWPNDVVVNGRKVVGILCEALVNPDGERCVVAGAGFNVNQRSFSGELKNKATSLFLEGGREIDRRALLCRYLAHMDGALELLEAQGFDHFFEAYAARSVTLGSRVSVVGAAQNFIGTAAGIDEAGALLVRLDTGETKRVLCGDVSVRGVMGYV